MHPIRIKATRRTVVMMIAFFMNITSLQNKKCAAEAAHEKCMAPLAATQMNFIAQERVRNRSIHFYRDKNVRILCKNYSFVSQPHCITKFGNCKHQTRKKLENRKRRHILPSIAHILMFFKRAQGVVGCPNTPCIDLIHVLFHVCARPCFSPGVRKPRSDQICSME